MTFEYIAALVFHPQNVSIVCLRQGEVVGGLVYRPHPIGPEESSVVEPFAELAFFVIASERQVEGLGSRLMTRLKAEARRQGLRRILVYGDDSALTFFHLQGFSHELTVPSDQYAGRIRHYRDSVLMECVLYADVPYARLSALVRSERRRILARWPCAPASPDEHPASQPVGVTRATELASPRAPEALSAIALQQKKPSAADHEPDAAHSAETSMQLIPLGKALTAALETLGRELCCPAHLETDFGAPGCGVRIRPAALGARRSNHQDALSAEISSTLLNDEQLAHLTAVAAVAADERRACGYYTEVSQAVADAHRYGFAHRILSGGSALRAALAPL